ncbi:unnamed protein product [Sphagnum troendelagicum]|uniref:BHLH domain-containing protein n=1 Tax=Sphagnum troendelagicum TaxID=128251 RepID=A0ABP0U3V3_9BRYO
MDQYAGSDDLELVNWEERLLALMQIWPWINYAVVWKLTPDKRALVWNTGYIDCNNDRSSQLLHGGRTNSDHSQRLAAIFYSIFKSCKFTNPSSGYAAKAFSRQSPLWWTSCTSPPLPTDPRKEKFLQQAGIQTIVCLPEPKISEGDILYCLELASTTLVMEASRTLEALQAFLFDGSSTAFPRSCGGLSSFDSSDENLLLPSLNSCGEDAEGVDAQRILAAVAGGVVECTCSAASPEHLTSASALALIPQLAETNLGSDNVCFDDDDDPGSQACNPVTGWFNVTESAAEVLQQTAFATDDDHVPRGVPRDHEEMSLRATAQDGAQAPQLVAMANRTTAASSNVVAGVSTTADMMLNLWASISSAEMIDEQTDQMMPGISSIIQRSTFDSLATAFEMDYHHHYPAKLTNFGDADAATAADQHHEMMSAVIAAATPFDNVVVGHSSTAGYDQDLAFHLLNQTSAAAAASHNPMSYDNIMCCIEPSPAAPSIDAASAAAAAPSAISRQPGTALTTPAGALVAGMLAADQRGAESSPPSAVIADQVMGIDATLQVSDLCNPFHQQQELTSSKSASRKLSPFELSQLDPSRNSKHRRFNDNSLSDVQMITPPVTTSEQSMIGLMKNLDLPSITESDRTTIRQISGLAAAPDQEQQQQELGLNSSSRSPALPTGSVTHLQELNFAAGWPQILEVEQAHIAYSHKMAERDRRSKFNDKFSILSTIVPTTKKKDKLSILTNAIDYIHKLKEQIAARSAENAGSSQRSTHQQAVQAPADSVKVEALGGLSLATAVAAAGRATTPDRNATSSAAGAVSVRVESVADLQQTAVGGVVAGDSDAAASRLVPKASLAIKVETKSKNPEILIQILNAVQDLRLDVGPVSSKLIHDRMHISVSALVPASSQQTMSWYCKEMQELLEKVLMNHSSINPVSLPLPGSSQSAESEPQLDTMTITSNIV